MRMTSRNSCVALAILFLASCDEDDGLGPSSIVETVAIVPGSFALIAGDSVQLTTIARGDIGNPLVGRTVTWESSVPTVATISAAGVLKAVSAGAANITATIDGIEGSAVVTVSPLFASVTFASVTSGGAHTCAVSTVGSAHCWGRGEVGQLGAPAPATTCLSEQTYPCALVPIPVAGGLSFSQLTGGGAHTCGLTTDGSAWCWGANPFGQLGDSTITARTAPVAVATPVKFASISAAADHTCGLTDSGAAWCWGRNNSGQLGDGTVTNRPAPVQVNLPTGVVLATLSAGGMDRAFSCALTDSGAAWCWGSNHRGQLGRGTRDFVPHSQPELVSGNLTFTSLSLGSGDYVCGLTAAGTAHCWGAAGALGDGSTTDAFLPVAVSGGIAFAQVTIGGFQGTSHTCGLTTTGAAYCWGNNEVGSVGDGSTVLRPTPVAVAGGLTFASIDAGFRHTCGRSTAGAVYCWGSGRVGQLGTNSRSSTALPVKVLGQP